MFSACKKHQMINNELFLHFKIPSENKASFALFLLQTEIFIQKFKHYIKRKYHVSYDD